MCYVVLSQATPLPHEDHHHDQHKGGRVEGGGEGGGDECARLTAQSFERVALDPSKSVLVYFYAPCKSHCLTHSLTHFLTPYTTSFTDASLLHYCTAVLVASQPHCCTH